MKAESPVSAADMSLMASRSPQLDELDRRIIAALQVNGRATWQQVARAVGASESTVSRRANRLLAGGVVRIVGIADPIRCGLGSPVLLQVTCAVGAVGAVARSLATRPDVRFLGLLTGTYDLVLEVIVTSRSHLATVLVDQLSAVPGIEKTTTETVLRNFKTSYDWSREVLGEGAGQLTPVLAEDRTGRLSLTATDLELVQHLGSDGRLSLAELSLRTGAGESAIRRRLELLTGAGALRFATLVDPPLMGYHCEAFLWLDVDLARLEEVATALGGRSEVRYLSATAGYSDLVAELVLRDHDDLYRFNTEVLAALPGIRRSETAIELQTVKRGYLTHTALH